MFASRVGPLIAALVLGGLIGFLAVAFSGGVLPSKPAGPVPQVVELSDETVAALEDMLEELR